MLLGKRTPSELLLYFFVKLDLHFNEIATTKLKFTQTGSQFFCAHVNIHSGATQNTSKCT